MSSRLESTPFTKNPAKVTRCSLTETLPGCFIEAEAIMSHRIQRTWKEKLKAAVPFGLGQDKPGHFRDMIKIAWKNRDNLNYAWKVLSKGVCDGCALGVAGFHDWTIDGVHLCMTRLNLLRLNTAPPLDERILADVSNPANDQPVAMKYLEQAKKHGTKVALVNPYKEPGMERYWVPSSLTSSVFGTKIADFWFPVAQGGDIAFLYGVLKVLLAEGWH